MISRAFFHIMYLAEELSQKKVFKSDGTLEADKIGKIMLRYENNCAESLESDNEEDVFHTPGDEERHPKLDHHVTSLSKWRITVDTNRDAQEMFCKVLSYLQVCS